MEKKIVITREQGTGKTSINRSASKIRTFLQ